MLVFKPSENLLLLPPKIFTTTTNSKTHHLHLHHHDVKLHFPPLKAQFKSTLSSPLPPPPPPQPQSDSSPPAAADSSSSTLTTTTTVDFLMDSCGLSYEEAIQVIRKKPTLLLQDDRGRKSRSVIAYFESIGFSKTTHISKIISRCPRVLTADVETTLKPKIQLFQDFGFSESDIADLIARQPPLLHRSVKNQIKPTLQLIRSFVKTDADLIKIIKRYGILQRCTYRRDYIEANIDVLRRHHGVPDSEIVNLILTRLSTLTSTPKVFKSIVKRIVILGFKPETRKFLTAVSVMCSMKKATWDSKIDLLKGLGWSDEQILHAFIRHPIFLALSRENLKESIEFYKEISSLNWDDTASVLSQYPFILYYSLKARVIPRYAVFKCLMSKDIISIKQEDTLLFIYMLKLKETQFLSKYVFEYQDQLPYLYEVYKKERMLGGCKDDNRDREITNQQDQRDHVDITV